mgnify:FL=1
MKKLNGFSVFTALFLLTISCSSNKEINENLPYPTENIYFQNWVGGQQQTGGGTNFHVKFKQALPTDVTLKKVYFLQKEASFDKNNGTTYTAHFFYKPSKTDLILDENPVNEYGNKAPEIKTSKTDFPFVLKEDEAILEFVVKNKTQLYKIKNIPEKELLAYPSARPRN